MYTHYITMHTITILEKGKIRRGDLNAVTTGATAWVDFGKPSADELAWVAKHFATTREHLTSLLSSHQRPIITKVGNGMAVIFSAPVESKANTHTIPLVLLITANSKRLITLHQEPVEALSFVSMPTVTRSPGLAFGVAVLTEVVENYFHQLDHLSDMIVMIERSMFDYRQSKRVMGDTFTVKKGLVFLHKALVANREVIFNFEKQYAKALDAQSLELLQQMNADAIQLIEMVTTYRDIITSTIEIHLTVVSNNLNVTMKKVTSWGALILVPSLIAGIFGMNFRYIPTLAHPSGFYIALGVMVVSVSGLIWYFKRRDWL